MYSKLQDGVNTAAAFTLQFGKSIDIPGVEYERFLAYDIGADSEGKAGMGVMQVVW